MSQLVIVGFNGKYKADEVILDLLKKEQQHLRDLEDAVVITRNAQGKLRIKPYYDILSAIEGHKSQFWGPLFPPYLKALTKKLYPRLDSIGKFARKLRR